MVSPTAKQIGFIPRWGKRVVAGYCPTDKIPISCGCDIMGGSRGLFEREHFVGRDSDGRRKCVCQYECMKPYGCPKIKIKAVPLCCEVGKNAK